MARARVRAPLLQRAHTQTPRRVRVLRVRPNAPVACACVCAVRELPVRVEAAMALRSFVEALDDPAPLTPILPQLMESIFRLMNEVCVCARCVLCARTHACVCFAHVRYVRDARACLCVCACRGELHRLCECMGG